MDRPEPAVADRGERPLDRGDVADPAALRDEPAARSQDRRQVAEQRVVVGDPVERGGREDRVDRAARAAAAAEVGHDELDPVAEPGQPLARGRDHRGRPVERDHPPARQPRARSSVTRPEPQPASRTVSSPASARRSSTAAAPAGHRGPATRSYVRRPSRGSGAPVSPGRRPARRRCRREPATAVARVVAGTGPPAQPEPRHERPEQQQRAHSRIARWKRVDRGRFGRRDLRRASPGARRVQRLERRPDGGIGGIEPGAASRAPRRRWPDGDEDQRPEEGLADPGDGVVDGRPEPRVAARDRAHEGARERRHDQRDADAEQEHGRQDVDERRAVGTRLDGSPSDGRHGAVSAGMRASHSSPAAISSGPERPGTAAPRSAPATRPDRGSSRASG